MGSLKAAPSNDLSAIKLGYDQKERTAAVALESQVQAKDTAVRVKPDPSQSLRSANLPEACSKFSSATAASLPGQERGRRLRGRRVRDVRHDLVQLDVEGAWHEFGRGNILLRMDRRR